MSTTRHTRSDIDLDSAPTTPGPSVSTPFPYGTASESPTRQPDWPATPGAASCPECSDAVRNVQGLLDCPSCDWSGLDRT